jgi:hypothetical protein
MLLQGSLGKAGGMYIVISGTHDFGKQSMEGFGGAPRRAKGKRISGIMGFKRYLSELSNGGLAS